MDDETLEGKTVGERTDMPTAARLGHLKIAAKQVERGVR